MPKLRTTQDIPSKFPAKIESKNQHKNPVTYSSFIISLSRSLDRFQNELQDTKIVYFKSVIKGKTLADAKRHVTQQITCQ